MEHGEPDPLRERYPRVLITGAGGQLGWALREILPWADARDKLGLDVRTYLAPQVGEVDLVLHAAAWTQVDLAETDDREGAVRVVNVLGTKRVVELGAPVVYFSTDYVFDGTKGAPYVESDTPRPLSVYGRSKLDGEREVGHHGWILRTSWLFGPTGHNFVRTMLRLGAERDEVSVVDDQRGCPTYVGHLAAATHELLERDLPYGVYHLAAQGDCTWADFAEAIFEEAGLPCRVRRITTAELALPAPRPAHSVLRSEKARTPVLPHWREGLRACLERLAAG